MIHPGRLLGDMIVAMLMKLARELSQLYRRFAMSPMERRGVLSLTVELAALVNEAAMRLVSKGVVVGMFSLLVLCVLLFYHCCNSIGRFGPENVYTSIGCGYLAPGKSRRIGVALSFIG